MYFATDALESASEPDAGGEVVHRPPPVLILRAAAGSVLAAAALLSLAITLHAGTPRTITIKRPVVKMTHLQCVLLRMSRAANERERANADAWCTKRGDTVPRKW